MLTIKNKNNIDKFKEKNLIPVRLGIIGAGAIVKAAYLPALKDIKEIRLAAIVDTDQFSLDKMASEYDLKYHGRDIGKCLDFVDVVIIACPNYLHASMAIYCMKAGIHVLCEKPMTICTESASKMVDCARNNNVKLAVAHVRRFYPSSQSIRQIIKKKVLGDVVSFDCKEGLVFNWPTVSGFFFDREKAGGGVLMDTGVHLLDLLMWWFDSKPTLLEYEDDNLGGVEAFSKIKLKFNNDVEGTVTISRLSQLRNTYRINCEKGTIEYSPFDMKKFFTLDNDPLKKNRRKIFKATKSKFSYIDCMKAMIKNFCTAVHENGEPLVTGKEGIKVAKLIQECYQNRIQIDMPWL